MSSRTSDDVPLAVGRAGGLSPAQRRALERGLLITGTVFAAGSLASVVRLPALPVLVTCAVLGAGIILAAVLTAGTGWAAAHASACAAAGAGWLAYAATTTAWSLPAAAALLLPAGVLAWLYPVIRAREAGSCR
jgi:hypothetical protein